MQALKNPGYNPLNWFCDLLYKWLPPNLYLLYVQIYIDVINLKKTHTNCRLLYKLFCTSPFVLNIFEVVIDTHIGLSVLFNGYIIVCCMDVLEFI